RYGVNLSACPPIQSATPGGKMADSARVQPISRRPGTANRWGIALPGVIMQIALGAVYAWSVFRIPLTKAFGWTISQVTLTFTITIFTLGVTAFFGGLWMAKRGPRRVAMVAGVLYGVGVMLASLSANRLEVLYITYGV